ncbi:LysR family transcriptional regulator [Pseudomonas sp. HAR-UPW-AIA-41]|uniref:LysR family transcriptional regulator n=1 Tax=Pseudomonas sp. HAR-UPW-AIA-41 TaxID=1985301 RepID=UPI000BB2DC7F|nr:LysR family transcriptional regulator [Pseudomonas sp. HAR-UPW-AIA-41]PAV47850.1 LysR family transcriptional regulator [Pseudomonas sp. HAR-UPW-AIA-41]
MSLNKDAVQVFLAVLDKGSFSAAARSLGRVPSAVSMCIANLEADLNLLLFDRSGREPRPTAAAQALETKARFLLQQFESLETQALALSQGLESRLSLAIAPELLASPWAIPLSRVAERYPALDVEVLAAPEADAINLLHEGRVQLALVFESTQFDSRECCQEMTRETLITVIAPTHPALASGRPLRMEELAEHRQILVAGRDNQERTPRFLQAHQHWRTDSHTAALSLIQAGLGWGFLPLSLVRPQLQAGTLIQLHLDNISNSGTLWVDLVWSRRRPLGLAAQYFIALIRQKPAVPI